MQIIAFRTNIYYLLGGLLRCASSHIRTWSQSGEHISSISKPRNSEATVIRRSVGHLLGYRFDSSGPSAEDTYRYSCGNCVWAFTAAALHSHSGERVGHPRVRTEKVFGWPPGRSVGRRSSSRSFSGSAMVGTRGGGAAAASGGDRGSSTSRANSSSSRQQPSADEKGGDLDDDGQVSHDDIVELLNCNFRNDAHFVCESARVDVEFFDVLCGG